jgi:hypothetical protein
MKPSSEWRHFHAVRFYDNQESLCRMVADFLGQGVLAGDAGLVIGSSAHNAEILEQLSARKLDVEALRRTGDLLFVDAHEMLTTFMVDGLPDGELFKSEAGKALDRLLRGQAGRRVRAYGEMVDLLWKRGNSVGAIKLEVLWNLLAMTHDFSLLCGYAMGNFYKNAGVSEVCEAHTHVVADDGTPVRLDGSRAAS